MKKCCLIWIFILLQYVKGEDEPECITPNQLHRAMIISCIEQRDNKTLWNNLIECHRPISDEFMRSSAEARCPFPKNVYDTTNTQYSMVDVFFNICSLIEGSQWNMEQGRKCLLNGRYGIIRSHKKEVEEVKKRFGADVPCKIGECVLSLGYDLGE